MPYNKLDDKNKIWGYLVLAIILFLVIAVYYVSEVFKNHNSPTEDPSSHLAYFGLLFGIAVAYLVIKKEPTAKRIVIGSILGVSVWVVTAFLNKNHAIAFYFEIVFYVILALVVTAILIYWFYGMNKDYEVQQKRKEKQKNKYLDK